MSELDDWLDAGIARGVQQLREKKRLLGEHKPAKAKRTNPARRKARAKPARKVKP